MANEDRFKQIVVTTIAKRAANRCSNPDCRAITSGPGVAPMATVNVGEAAHIYGANLGSARYAPDMTSANRSAITNAIWLCGNCHKLVDDDEQRFPAGLLFEWQREHERVIAEHVGKAGAELRRRYEDRHLEEFGKLSYLAERIILEKGSLWEYRLTSEVLRFEMAPIARRWGALKRGLYVKPSQRIGKEDFYPWIQARLHEVRAIVNACNGLMNDEFARAWGASGVPGSDRDIVDSCRLYAGVCQSIISWEEDIRFTSVHHIFRNLQDHFTGVAGVLLEEALKVPEFLSDTLSQEGLTGTHTLSLTLSLPDGWGDEAERLMEKSVADFAADLEG
ncbi:HNH endonuclease [Brevundimonas sp. LPMIX5]|uniref:HNH endonuclease n=1 Tax=Brevundimonas sp. LPMIX5 TaxID=2305887 RepID=UPI000E6697E4|nr:HNH endonuclease [Brevundimonas sp. LPMIX5]RIJ66174.1 HNH endonuclease [Brevundimonas sp. LPMIX5]